MQTSCKDMNKNIQIKIRRQKNRLFSTLIFLLSIFLGVNSIAYASPKKEISLEQLMQQKKISLNFQNKHLKYILSEIEKMTGIGYVIKDDGNTDAISKLSINVKDVTVEQALTTLLQKTGYGYKIDGGIVVISKEKKESAKSLAVSNASTITISGEVIDAEEHKPIAGATVIVLNTTSGAITDINGKFVINIKSGERFEISYTGLATQIIKAEKPESKLTIVMKKDAMVLDDVVVTGYGDVKKSSYTGNSVVVKREELLKASKTNVLKALQSFDPSFRIKENNQWGSDPNALPEVYIRGESGIGVKELDNASISKSNLKDNPNLPTFIMDGFEISVTKLYDYDPNRIESITILKDAAATALYGSRAANGVVIIKTVAPKAGRVNVSYNFVADVTMPDLSDYNLMNAAEKLEAERVALCYVPEKEENSSTYWQEYHKFQNEYNAKMVNVLNGVDTYWLSQPLQSIFNHKHSLYVDGGSENLRFGVDLQYTKQDGVMRGSNRDRIGAGFFIQYNYKTLTIKNNTTYLSTQSSESKYGNFADYTKQLPYDVFKNEDGRYFEELRSWDGSSTPRVNPFYEPSLNNFDQSKNEEFINNLSARWYILPSLQFNGQVSLTKTMGSSERFLDPLSKRKKDVIKSLSNQVSGELYMTNSDGYIVDANATLSYSKDLNGHMINLLAGVNSKESLSEGNSATYRGFPSSYLTSPNYAKEMTDKTQFNESKSRMMGVLASLNYSYKDIYMLDASFRVDGSSAFGSEKRFAPFWSAGAGVNLHKYKFMEDVKWMNLLKVRGTYGQTGKANFPAYAARTSYLMFTDDWYKTGYGMTIQALGNPNLKWETTNTLDVGFEAILFNNLLYLKASYYDKTTIDLITDVTIPSSTGFKSYRDNIGEVSNKGYEVDFRISPIRRKDMNLVVNLNLAHNKNRIEKISESLKAYNKSVTDKYLDAKKGEEKAELVRPFLQYVEGGSLNSIFAVQSLGINPADGTEVFLRPDGSTTDVWSVGDQIAVGNKDPKVQGNFGLNFQYKQFSIYATFMYEFGGQRYNSTLVSKIENVDIYRNNADKRVLTGRWQKPGDNAQFISLKTGRNQGVYTNPTSRFIQDYNMLSLSSIELGYDFTSNVTKKLGMSMLRITAGMNDIMYLSSVKQERGLSYPFARSINFSVKISF